MTIPLGIGRRPWTRTTIVGVKFLCPTLERVSYIKIPHVALPREAWGIYILTYTILYYTGFTVGVPSGIPRWAVSDSHRLNPKRWDCVSCYSTAPFYTQKIFMQSLYIKICLIPYIFYTYSSFYAKKIIIIRLYPSNAPHTSLYNTAARLGTRLEFVRLRIRENENPYTITLSLLLLFSSNMMCTYSRELCR